MKRHKTILVVEDDELLNRLITDTLKTKGYRVLQAHTGDQALSVVDSQDIDLMLLDLDIPNIHGLDLLRQIKQSKLPIIVVSGCSDEDSIVNSYRSGAVYFHEKPIKSSVLLTQIEIELNRTDSAEIVNINGFTFNLQDGLISHEHKEVPITSIESSVIRRMLASHPHFTSKQSLLYQIWGDDSQKSRSAMYTCVSRLRAKMKKAFGRELIESRYSSGLKISP